MPLFAGKLLLRDAAVEGWLEVEAGRCVAWGEGPSPTKPDATGWIVPAPVNGHTHVADAALRDAPGKPTSLAALVGPGGWKEHQLARMTPAALEAGVRRYAEEMAACGTARFLDFREGGLAGVEAVANLTDLAVEPFLLGRPARNTFDAREAEELLAIADGIGLSARRDFRKPEDVEAWAEATHRAGKPFALHASEAVREDWDAILALEPDLLVHALRATPEEWEEAAQQRIPLVVTPRSNAHFGFKTPLPAMLEAGLTVAIGTDNGMLQDGNLWAELGQLAAWYPKLSTETLLRLATWNSRALLGLPAALPPRKGQALDVVVLPEVPWTIPSRRPALEPRQLT
ncbi:MAG: amidohydrolase family protein [Candidatus Thermoplasmatota archaeon]